MIGRKHFGLATRRTKLWMAIESSVHVGLRLTCLPYQHIRAEKKSRAVWKTDWKEFLAKRATAFRSDFSNVDARKLPMWIVRWNKYWKAVHCPHRVALCLTFMAYKSIKSHIAKRSKLKTEWKEKRGSGIERNELSEEDEWSTEIEEDSDVESSSGPSCSEINSSSSDLDSPCESSDENDEHYSSSKVTDESGSEDHGPFVNRGMESEEDTDTEPETEEEIELDTDDEVEEEPMLEADDCTLQFPMDPVTMKRFEKIIEKSNNWTEKQQKKGFAKWAKKNPDLKKKLDHFFKDDTAAKHHHEKLRLRKQPKSIIINKVLTVLFIMLIVEHFWTTYGNNVHSDKK